ncbi:hypothetical protein H310_13171 [Aphanomyces invadans]|uniref:EGF-like domain-containing protein n=1 Tax=Aphanomyces invadans TaxID=157072 RepID=A0A024TGN1_9STRA|nr:hypothetical protein H310_13171 [Aphanomyces invadans]ETV92482.1 hypothetical protein H310_13171 [Aphanomyces invadans]|eukprot:XP_008878789.1 hypothetical protein H310_13171 [Aphanomyces invadans]
MLWQVLRAATAAAALLGASEVEGGKLAPIIVRGNRMYNSETGERFFIRGITYDYDVSDANYDLSRPIIETNLKALIGSFNTFRLYNVNPDLKYDKFMKHMDSLGVYVLVSGSPANLDYYGDYKYSTITKTWSPDGTSVVENGVTKLQKDQTKTCYPALLLKYGKSIIKDFAPYDNTLGVVVANEIMQHDLTAAACVKAYTSDLKNWMRVNAKSLRILPLAYAGADSSGEPVNGGTKKTPEVYTVMKIMGLLCGDSMKNGMMERSIDIYLINEYRWCNVPGTFAPYEQFLEMAKGVPIVMALGEFGCDTYTPRTWTMVPYLFSDSIKSKGFTDVYSGGLAYTFGQASLGLDAKYPLFTGGSIKLEELPGKTPTADYTNLLAQFKANPSVVQTGAFTKDTICKWNPPEPTPGANPIFAVTKTWMPECKHPSLKLDPTDKWETNTRQGAVCNKKGEQCEVVVETPNPTTEESICGFEVKVPEGGGTCTTNENCGSHGQCIVGDDKTRSCACIGCYSGSNCAVYNADKCNTLSSNADAPKVIFTAVGAFLGVMLLVFGGLGIAAGKKTAELRKAEQVAKNQMNSI